MSRVALVFERFGGFQPVLEVLTQRVEKLGMEYLRAVLERDGHDVLLIDNELERKDPDSLARTLNTGRFDFIGLSVNSGNLNTSDGLTAKLDSEAFVIWGGVAPSLHATEVLEHHPRVDGIVLGEGEVTLSKLVEMAPYRDTSPELPGLVTRLHEKPAPSGPTDLDALPRLGRPRLAQYDVPTLSTSRGCRFACSYCAESRFLRQSGVRWHGRSADLVVGDLTDLVRNHGARSVWIVDGDFIGTDPARITDICHGILNEDLDLAFEIDARADDVEEGLFSLLRDAGLRRVFIGVETMSERLLRQMKKGIKPSRMRDAIATLQDLGINVTVGMIIFQETTRYEELLEDIAFMDELGWENVGSHLFLGMKDYTSLCTTTPSHFDDDRVERAYREARDLEKRLNWCYADRVTNLRSAAERRRLIHEISNAIGYHFTSLMH